MKNTFNIFAVLFLLVASPLSMAQTVDQVLINERVTLTGSIVTSETDLNLAPLVSSVPCSSVFAEVHLFLKATIEGSITEPIAIQIIDKLALANGKFKPLIWHAIRPESINNGTAVANVNVTLSNCQPELALKIATAGSDLGDNIAIKYTVVATRLL